MPGNKTQVILITLATGNAGNQSAIGNNGPGGITKSQSGVCGLGFPAQQSGARVDGNDTGIFCCRVNYLIIDRNIFLRTATSSGVVRFFTGNCAISAIY